MGGILYGLGLGPGDPELVTVKAVRRLGEVATVFVPVARPGAPSYARAIAEPYLDLNRQRVVELLFPVGPDRAAWRAAWAAAAERVVAQLAGGEAAAFVTEGDPSLYSTFQYLRAELVRRCPDLQIEVVPGIPSAFAAAAVAGLPLALGDESFAIVPATRGIDAVRHALLSHEAVALLKVAPVFDQMLDLLESLGLVQHAVWIRRVGRPEMQLVHDLATLRGHKLDYFSLLLVRRPNPTAGDNNP